MVWRCKDIKWYDARWASWGIDNKIEGLNISEIKKSRSSDETSTGFPQLIHWCVAVASVFSVLISIILPVTMYSKNPLIRNHRLFSL